MGNFINCIICKKINEHESDELFQAKKKVKSDAHINQEIIKHLEEEMSLSKDSENLKIENSPEISDKKVSIEDFSILRVLGRGSFGKVLLVEKKDNKGLYAMKVLRKSNIAQRNQKEHTQAERYILENMKSPFIVQLHFAFQTADKLFLVLDFMQGGEMFFHLRKCRAFDEMRTKLYIAELVLALDCLHSNCVIYRDLKPENILLDADGHIKVSDFGLSKHNILSNQKTYTLCGTPEYLAPEILLGKGHDKSVDWWSLGAVLYEMLTGAPPHYSHDKSEMCRNILTKPIEMKSYFSPEVTSLLKGLLCLDPKKRLGSSENDAHEIKSHPFFKDIDWEKVFEKKYTPPFKPKLLSEQDLRYFDKMFTNEKIKETPAINNDIAHNDLYSNFTYEQLMNLDNKSSVSIEDRNKSEIQNEEPLKT